ncbi:hypothetical protein Misp01_49770 [Microtetraspora sp. NBRC 13810]|uniref:M15 family metallopeptidase n=1 Tax=Microtetraspora sp. NBRC 13810 TaxID=3030990 RepID=UPI0024A5E758|nr:M15 family metallopeptidase [Microtetraspora sp. NBRC 13810]GLW09848.1 hypothetical protein Misp01_49770 [Microtetraspora sp. NBRC 13810]
MASSGKTPKGTPPRRAGTAAVLVVGCVAGLVACGQGEGSATALDAATRALPASTQPGTASATPTASSAEPTPTGPPAFTSSVSKVTRDLLRYSWRPGCPVPLSDLRLVKLTYWGFDDRAHTGELVVRDTVTDDVQTIFKRLYAQRYPIYRMRLVDVYKGDDFDSIDADNTSAFNCRPATGSSSWSKHAYGEAIDINPRENPYRHADGTVEHENAREFARRPLDRPGVVNAGDRVVRTFAAFGWEWGGSWAGTKDFQHFSKGGG